MLKLRSLEVWVIVSMIAGGARAQVPPAEPPAAGIVPIEAPARTASPRRRLFEGLGARFALETWWGRDSNVLRLANGTSDSYRAALPSIAVVYAVAKSTDLTLRYQFGIDRYSATPLLDISSHRAELRATHRFGGGWGMEAYGALERSNQPDVLTTRSALTFASFRQSSEGWRIFRDLGRVSRLSLEYGGHQRSYSSRRVGPALLQEDTFHSLTLAGSHQFGRRTWLRVLAGYRLNLSNAPSYRFDQPFVSAQLTVRVGRRFLLESYEQLATLRFAERRISGSATQNRSDSILTSTLGVRYALASGFDLVARYTVERDASNDPQRRFTDQRFLIGLNMRLSRAARVASPAGGSAHARAVALSNRAYRAVQRQDFAAALRDSLDALALDPDLAPAHTNAGIACYKTGRLDEAIAHWRRSLAIESTNTAVHRLLEQALREKR